jgi:hypothetical protein
MRFLPFIISVFLLTAPAALADIYHWTDDEGVLHITSDLNKVPERYRGKVTVIESEPEEEGPLVEPTPPAPEKKPQREGEELFGGLPLSWWQKQFIKMYGEISKAEAGYNRKKQYVDVFEKGRRFGQVFDDEEIESYERFKKELPADEKWLERLRGELEELRRKATNAGVPKEVRGE